jgi:hypothetical protein
MTQTVTHDSRKAIERAKLFLAKAKNCSTDQRVDFEAYLEASIIFARTAMLRIQGNHKKKKEFKDWWDSLKKDPSVLFFRYQRNPIIHKHPPKLGQILQTPLIPASGHVGGQPVEDDEPYVIDMQTISSEEHSHASDLYYYKNDPSTPITQTVEDHLNKLEGHINAFLNDINNS